MAWISNPALFKNFSPFWSKISSIPLLGCQNILITVYRVIFVLFFSHSSILANGFPHLDFARTQLELDTLSNNTLLSPTGNAGVRVENKMGVNIFLYTVCFWFCFSAWFCSSLNAFVHIIMYTYYALAAIPSMRGKLWWKKYITRLQLVRNSWLFIAMKKPEIEWM